MSEWGKLARKYRRGIASESEYRDRHAENRRKWLEDPVQNYFVKIRNLYWLEPFHERWLEHQCFNERTLVLAPRDHRKTTLLNIEWWPWRILTWPDWNIRGCLIIYSALRAQEVVQAVRTILDMDLFRKAPELRAVYGTFVGNRWTQSAFTIAHRTQTELKEPTLAAFGFKGSITSGHYDVTVIDDPITLDDTRTHYMREQSIIRFQQGIVPTLRKEVHVIGHPWWPGDFYDYLKEEHLAPGYKVKGNKVLRTE